MTVAYVPQAGTLAARVVAHFALLALDAEVANNVLAEALAVDANILTPCLQAPMRHGLLERFKAEGRIYWRRGRGQPPTPPLADDADLAEDADDPAETVARTVPSTSAEPIVGLERQSWCPAAQDVEPKSSLDELPAPLPPSPAPPPLGLGWKAPHVPVYRGEPPAPVPSPRPPAAPGPGPAAARLKVVPGVSLAEDDPDFREVERAPRPPEPDTPPKGAEAAQAPVSPCGRDDATPNDGVVPQESQFRCALWSSGELHIELYPGNFLLLTKAETRRLVGYLDRMAEASE